MTRSRIAFSLLLVGLLAISGLGQEKRASGKKAPEKAPMDTKAAMDMMMKLAMPGPGHKKLDALIGSWTMKQTMWMEPGKAPTSSEGTAEHRWVLEGRFVEQKYEGKFMEMPFHGIGYAGYDNYKKKYVSTWMDNFGTMIMMSTGTFDAAGKVLTTKALMDDPSTGKSMSVTEKLTFVSDDELMMEMWGPAPDGKEFRMMELRYTRKK